MNNVEILTTKSTARSRQACVPSETSPTKPEHLAQDESITPILHAASLSALVARAGIRACYPRIHDYPKLAPRLDVRPAEDHEVPVVDETKRKAPGEHRKISDKNFLYDFGLSEK